MRSRWITLGIPLSLGAAAAGGARQATPCVRPPARAAVASAPIVIAAPTRIPCTFRTVDTPVELRADEAGRVAGIGSRILRAPDGRFFTTWRTEVSVWSADGRFIRNIGGQGGGPGEFFGAPKLFFDAAGRLFALDRNRWTVYSPSLELLGTRSVAESQFGGPGSRHDTDGATLLDDGTFLSGDLSAHGAGSYFVIWDVAQGRGAPASSSPPVIRTFDPVRQGEAGAAYRAIGYAGGDTFWAGPPMMTSGRGYELELWRTDGTKLRTIRREVSWFPQRPNGGRGRAGVDVPPPPGVGGILVDRAGLLYVFVTVPNEHWRPPRREDGSPPPPRPPNPPDPADIYMDVIDPEAGVLLASAGPMPYGEAIARLPITGFRGTSWGYRVGETSDGLSFARILEHQLVAQ